MPGLTAAVARNAIKKTARAGWLPSQERAILKNDCSMIDEPASGALILAMRKSAGSPCTYASGRRVDGGR
jgi:hypothetical protein